MKIPLGSLAVASALLLPVAIVAAAPAPAAASSPEVPKPPVPRVEPVTETFFGTEITDDYRWMENDQDPDWLPYIKGQDAYARATLAAIPGRDAMLKRVQALSGDAAVTKNVQVAGKRIFFEQRPAGADNYKLFVREGNKDRVLVDPTQLGTAEHHISLDWWAASPDGSHVVYGLSPAGSEDSVAQMMVVESGEILPERIDKVPYASPNWLNDGSGFFYNRLVGEKNTVDYYKKSKALLHRLRTDPATDVLMLQQASDPAVPITETEFPIVNVTPGSDLAVVVLVNGVQRELRAYTAPTADVLSGKAKWQKVCDTSDKVTSLALLGADLYVLANNGAVRGRVLKMAALSPDLAAAKEALPMGSTVIEELFAAREGVYVKTMDGGIERLRRIGANDKVVDIALPYEGSIQSVFATTGADGAMLHLDGWVQPNGIWKVDPAKLTVTDTGITPKPPINLSAYTATRLFATAKDGVKVPVAVVSRKDTPRDGKRPTIVQAYGSYQVSSSPVFRARVLAFLDAGGVLAVAGVRGGGEYGREWHEGGRDATKPNTWRDLIASCETLIAAKYTQPSSLAIKGGSAGGITVGRALTERPDLFAAVISNVGASNTLRAEFSPNGPPNIPEFGTLTNEQGFRNLLAMDSTQAVKKGTKYPAILLTTGATDPRVSPWEIAKMTALLQAATASDKPVLMRVEFDAGHGIGSTRAQTDAVTADEFAFVLWQAGAPKYQLTKRGP